MRKVVAVLVFAMAFGTAARSAADPIPITSGRVSGSVSSVTDYSISGDGFLISGILGAAPPGEPHWQCGFGCAAGSSLDLSTLYDQFEGTEVNGSVTSELSGFFRFDSESIVIPDLAVGMAVVIERPFVFAGQLDGIAGMGTVDLSGIGNVRAFLINSGADGVTINRTDFVFADPVPEPASLFLAGAGLAALVRRGVTSKRRPREATNA